ncbi:hypothetical protein NXS98_04080 [Fontisphaera persica]|uniref:hypothetical protein n=1 Tax=Fontisphaera persica TaxID=2974023 RepID=UPI0024BFFB76|nr:hypothetical protein [Fontisphaera persica]WCJ60319.1 hypothetical protein NXS98_04080 [Fontisphaera persica]
MNSREKGKRGERQWRDVLRAEGFHARRGQQFAGGADSPDVVCEELRGFHFEVKAVERLNIEAAMDQARRDAGPVAPAGQKKLPLVAHRRSHRRWLVTMEAETFFRILRDDLPSGTEDHGVPRSDRCRPDEETACPKEQDAQGTGDPRSDRCRGGTGHGGGDGAGQGAVTSDQWPVISEGAEGGPRRSRCNRTGDAGADGGDRTEQADAAPRMCRCHGTGTGGDGGCGHRREQGATLQHQSQPTVSPGEAVAAGTGRAGDTGGDQAGNESAADGGPRMSRWPGTGEGGADSGGAATTQPQGVESIRPPSREKDANGLPGHRATRTDQVTAPSATAGEAQTHP